jgi:hypothetical protein
MPVPDFSPGEVLDGGRYGLDWFVEGYFNATALAVHH